MQMVHWHIPILQRITAVSAGRLSAVEMRARYRCKACSAPLPKRDARCRACGFATAYDSRSRQQEITLGVSLVIVGVVLAIALAIAFTYVRPLP